MFKSKFVVAALIVAASIGAACKASLTNTGEAPPQAQAPAMPLVVDGVRTSYADIVDKTSPAVVRIVAERKEKVTQNQQGMPEDMFHQFPNLVPRQGPGQNQRPQVERGLGSGVIVSADGSILTNHHVVDGAEKITVLMSDNKSYDAKIVGTDKPSDLAVLKIEAQSLPFLTLGNSDGVRIGDIVLAIGNPLGIGQTVTAGIISAKGRRTGLGDGTNYEDFLQTDAPINRGNSGGALVNLAGELIGINSQIASENGGGSIGIGFSIPSNMAKSVMEQILKDGKVHRGVLGIGIQGMSDDAAKALGLKDSVGILVNSVKPGGAADKAGVKLGDIITAINGEKLEDSNVLRNKVASTAPGTEIKLTILRDGKESEVTAKLDEFNPEDAKKLTGKGEGDSNGPKDQGGKLGLTLEPVTPQIAKQLGLDSAEGLVVSELDQNGPAADAGMARGDVILQINRKPVSSVADAKAALDNAGDKPVLLLVSRRGQTTYVVVKPE